MATSVQFLLFFILASCSQTPVSTAQLYQAKFAQGGIWAPSLDKKLRLAIRDYESRAHVKSGLEYGASVRNYSLRGKCPQEIERDLAQLHCRKQADVIREPGGNKPIFYLGKLSPILQFVCPDGGVFKIKPAGDPSSHYTPFPHGSRTLRYPAEASYRDYRDEVAKVGERGEIIPRSPGDLNDKALSDAWSEDAHAHLGDCSWAKK